MAARDKGKRNGNGEGGVYRRSDGRWEGKLFVDSPDGRCKRVSGVTPSEKPSTS
jgi:hypothetical protein